MRVIAITGRSGSGKSTVSEVYQGEGFTVLDADLAARKAVENIDCIRKLIEAFGDDIIDENNVLNRKKLAEKAFANEEQTKKLTDITHPEIVKILLNGIEKARNNNENIVFVDGAVIIGGIFEKYCDEFIVVVSPQSEAIKRIILRDNISEENAINRLNSQLSQEEFIQKANYILYNDKDRQNLIIQSIQLLEKLI